MERSALHRKLKALGIGLTRVSEDAAMSRIAYVNGRYRAASRRRGPCRGPRLPVRRRRLRGLRGEGRPAGRRAPPHGAAAALARANCASRCRCRRSALSVVLHETVRRNRVRDGIVYLQITRGVARRDHAFPPPGTRAEHRRHRAQPRSGAAARAIAADGIAVITVPDNRWARVDIKSVSLLPNVLAKQAAREQGAREAWFVDADGLRHRRLVVQRLDRHARRRGGHAPGRPRHPARHHPHRACSTCSRRTGSSSRSGRSRSPRPTRAREAFITSASQIVHAGGADRRPAGRQRRAGPGRDRAAARFPPATRKSPDD